MFKDIQTESTDGLKRRRTELLQRLLTQEELSRIEKLGVIDSLLLDRGIEKAYREGLVPKKVPVTRDGKTFEQTVWVRPEETGRAQLPKAPDLDFEVEKARMDDVLSKLRKSGDVKEKPLSDSFDGTTISTMKDNSDAYLNQYERFFDATTFNKARDISYKLIQNGSSSKVGFTPKELQSLVNDATDKLIYQEVNAWERQLGDHGIRHIFANIDMQNRILNSVKESGVPISRSDRFLIDMVQINHDMGYTTAPSRESLAGTKDHPSMSRQWFNKERDFYGKFFSKEQLDEMEHYIQHHDQSFIDWDEEPLLSALSVADNLSLFHLSLIHI